MEMRKAQTSKSEANLVHMLSFHPAKATLSKIWKCHETRERHFVEFLKSILPDYCVSGVNICTLDTKVQAVLEKKKTGQAKRNWWHIIYIGVSCVKPALGDLCGQKRLTSNRAYSFNANIKHD